MFVTERCTTRRVNKAKLRKEGNKEIRTTKGSYSTNFMET
jgi:hypothetical protein